MPSVRRALPLLAPLILLTQLPPLAAEEAPAKVGQAITAFSLKDTEGKAWRLADVKDAKVLVVIFIGTECPVNNAYMPRLAELHKEFDARGVKFVAINSNSQDSPARVAEHARKHGLPFPVLKDAVHEAADLFAARRTPEAFVLDAERKVRYRGRIDD